MSNKTTLSQTRAVVLDVNNELDHLKDSLLAMRCLTDLCVLADERQFSIPLKEVSYLLRMVHDDYTRQIDALLVKSGEAHDLLSHP